MDKTLSWRQVHILLKHLPPESATKTAIRVASKDSDEDGVYVDATEQPWSKEEHLLATLVDALHRLFTLIYNVNRSKSAPALKPPPPIPRPGVEVKKKTKLSTDAVTKLIARRQRMESERAVLFRETLRDREGRIIE